MTFPEAIRDGFAKYVTFRGRSSRPAYWWWYLFTLLAYIVAAVIDQVIGTFVITVIVSPGADAAEPRRPRPPPP